MKNILIYFPYNQRTVEQQSVMELLIKKGHRVFLLTLTPEGYLHRYVRKLGVQAFASPVINGSAFTGIFRNARHLVRFCRDNAIDVIIAHQQLAALPLIFARPFIKARTFYVRHNADEDYKAHPLKARWMNAFINKLSPVIIAPSDIVYDYMTRKEHVPERKMLRINYGYNFSQYEKADHAKAADIRNAHACSLLVISIARLAPVKRHLLMFGVIQRLRSKGLDVKFICLGDGPSKEMLHQWVAENGLEQAIFFKGIQPDIFDYLVAGDLLLHLSETEASNSVVKEAGLAERTAIVCAGAGDFSDYIEDGINGFLVDHQSPVDMSVEMIGQLYHNRALLKEMGKALNETVTGMFDIENVSSKYDAIIQ